MFILYIQNPLFYNPTETQHANWVKKASPTKTCNQEKRSENFDAQMANILIQEEI